MARFFVWPAGDPDTVCDVDAVQEATTCRECEDAIAETYRMVSPRLTCDCPEDSALAGDEMAFLYYDDDCQPQYVDVTYEGCAELLAENDDDAMCFE